MTTTPTATEIIDYIREKNILQNWTDEQIEHELERASNDNSLFYAINNDQECLAGIVIGRKLIGENNIKIMHITAIAVDELEVLQSFYHIYRKLFSSYKLLGGYRYGKMFLWDTKKLTRFEKLLERI